MPEGFFNPGMWKMLPESWNWKEITRGIHVIGWEQHATNCRDQLVIAIKINRSSSHQLCQAISTKDLSFLYILIHFTFFSPVYRILINLCRLRHVMILKKKKNKSRCYVQSAPRKPVFDFGQTSQETLGQGLYSS